MTTLDHSTMRKTRYRQRGVAAVELAVLLPILLTFLTVPVFYARCLWHYTVAQKAAQDAARYLASVSKAEMAAQASAVAAGDIAVEIARREIAELVPGSDIVGPTAICTSQPSQGQYSSKPCGSLVPVGTLPTTVNVSVSFTMADPIFNIPLWSDITITADVTMRYVGT